MANDKGRFSRHLRGTPQVTTPATLVPDANFSRNVSFHVIRNIEGDDIWIGRYLGDLIEVIAECHPNGLLVEIDGISYHLAVRPAPKGAQDG